jgi:hypothetical protein
MTKRDRSRKLTNMALAKLRKVQRDQNLAFARVVQAQGGTLYAVDIVMGAVTQRSAELVRGFSGLVRDSNVTCALPLVRLQLDNLLRLCACWCVEDQKTVMLALLKGHSLHTIRSKEGKPLSDRHLHEILSRILPWTSEVYRYTSSFIHLSKPAMMSPVTRVREDRVVRMSFGSRSSQRWSRTNQIEAVRAFANITTQITALMNSWAENKTHGRVSEAGSPIGAITPAAGSKKPTKR